MFTSWCALEDVCARCGGVGGILAPCCVSSYSHYGSSPSAMKDEMSPFGICSIPDSECVFADKLPTPVDRCSVHSALCVFVSVYCTVPFCGFFFSLTFLYLRPPGFGLISHLRAGRSWRKRAGVPAAPQRRLFPESRGG